MKKNSLKIGLLLDDLSVPLWIFSLVNQIINNDDFEINLIVQNKSAVRHNKSSYKTKFNKLLYYVYIFLENRFFKLKPNPFSHKNISEIYNGDILEVYPVQTKYTDSIKNQDIKQINSYNIDVFIRFGFKILKGDILNSCNYGVWSFHHGDND